MLAFFFVRLTSHFSYARIAVWMEVSFFLTPIHSSILRALMNTMQAVFINALDYGYMTVLSLISCHYLLITVERTEGKNL